MTDSAPFDFALHGQNAANAYRYVLSGYTRYTVVVKSILEAALPAEASIHSIEARAKSPESFERKARKPKDEDPTQPKYEDPLSDITDLAGVRVIAFFPKTLAAIDECIAREFNVIWKRDIGEDRFTQGRFGYRSVHYLVKLTDARAELAEYKQCRDLVAEIQVRTILQHAWAEMEHDIQYKSLEQIPTAIKRRFVALAGMLEIADREFQGIQDEDSSIRATLSASLQDDLTKTALVEHQRELLATEPIAATSPIPISLTVSSDKVEKDQIGANAKRARALIAAGKFADAVQFYDRAIAAAPNHYTLYIARAKARFLAGDRSGSLSDMDLASSKLPNDTAIPMIRRQIEDGVVTLDTSATEAWELSREGNEMLEQGNGEEAFALYSRAQQAGFRFGFATFNKAMACALIKDTDGASYFLDQLNVTPGLPMELNTLGLRAVVAVIAKRSAVASTRDLLERRREFGWYDYQQSPLRHLEVGLRRRDTNLTYQLARVFDILKLPQDGLSPS